ncbi:MAG: metal-dependent hydrolase [Zoogloeaceae bacterium]|jgi:inner membrane protein|nr:metal-dependent hydrolase [Zoogloeaceae bacterium]
MPTIITHTAPVLVLGAALGVRRVSPRLFWVAAFCTVLPDFDVIGFRFGVHYADLFGHRGFSHSLLFALLCGGLAALAASWLRCRRWLAFVLIFAAIASHIALDAATNGGLGVAAFWPVSDARYFFPWRPIQVSPFALTAFFSERGLKVLYSEFLWVWLPCLSLALVARIVQMARLRAASHPRKNREA